MLKDVKEKRIFKKYMKKLKDVFSILQTNMIMIILSGQIYQVFGIYRTYLN
jgi:hypothetical protein